MRTLRLLTVVFISILIWILILCVLPNNIGNILFFIIWGVYLLLIPKLVDLVYKNLLCEQPTPTQEEPPKPSYSAINYPLSLN